MTRTTRTLCSATTLALLMLGACNKAEHAGGPMPAPAPGPSDFNKDKNRGDPLEPSAPPTPINAELIFSTRCATCHGPTGKGDGPAAATLNPKPRNYTDPEWQKSVSDEQIKKTIVEGGAAVGKSPLMAPNPDLKGQEVVLAALVKKIRGFAAQPDTSSKRSAGGHTSQ
jgi:hypothetical protein